MIKGVEEFSSELKTRSLAKRETLEERDVPILESGSLDDVASSIAERSNDGVRCEGTRIEQGSGHTG